MTTDNVYISPVLVVSLIVGIFMSILAPPLGFIIILIGVNSQRLRLKRIRQGRRAQGRSRAEQEREERYRAWAGLPS